MDLSALHTNQRLVVEELLRRGVKVEILCAESELLMASYDRHQELILDRDSSINPHAASAVAADKYMTKVLLQRAGVSVPQGMDFDEVNAGLVYAAMLGLPLVVKPTFGSHGDNVSTDLGNLCEVKKAIDKILPKRFLVEEQFDGKEYRVFITRKGDYAVLHRDAAHVRGDGAKTIEALVSEENGHRTTDRFCPIVVDAEVGRYLAKHGRSLSSIPSLGEKVYLRRASNIAKGGVSEDYTDRVHPSVIDVAKLALRAIPGLPYAGIDLLATDVTATQTPASYRVIEVNTVPGVKMHMQPAIGTPRNVAKYIVDMMFPETA